MPHPSTPGLAAALLALAPAATAAPLQVAVSILPEQWLVEQIAGQRADVLVLVGPADNEATYSPSPAKLAALDGARVWFTIGVPFEANWQRRIVRDRPQLAVVDLSAQLPKRDVEGDAAHEGHAEGVKDPHVWTDPRLAARMAPVIAAALARLDPPHAQAYAAAADQLVARLGALHEELAGRLAPVAGRTFIVFHPSWGYFADAYRLEQLPIELGGREPGPRTLASVIERARDAGARAVFVQPQFGRRSAEAVAEAIGAVVIEADPLSPDYADNLRRVAAQMAAALADGAADPG
jgi:zinc transport system substrate-binding protein